MLANGYIENGCEFMTKKGQKIPFEISRLISSAFEESKNQLYHDDTETSMRNLLSYSDSQVEKRIRATKHLYPEVMKRFSNKYGNTNCSNGFIGLSSTPHQGAPHLEYLFFPDLAACLWILDNCSENGLIEELLSFLPEALTNHYSYGCPQVNDTLHSQALIDSVYFCIQERDELLKEEFGKIVKLIEGKETHAICRQFTEDAFTYIDYFLKFSKSKFDVRDQGIKELVRELSDKTESGSLDKMDLLDLIEEEEERLNDKVFSAQSIFMVQFPFSQNESNEYLVKHFGQLGAEIAEAFQVKDPFETCAAYLLLSYKNDDIINITSVSAAVLYNAVSKLPWAVKSNLTEKTETYKPDYSLKYPVVDLDNPDQVFNGYENFPQLLFNSTGWLYPRHTQQVTIDYERVIKLGLPEITLHEIACLSTVLMNREIIQPDRYLAQIIDTKTEEPSDQESCDRYDSTELDCLRKEIALLRSSLHDAERRARQAEQVVSKTKEQSANELKELYDLREALFQLRHDKAEPDEENNDINFPYETPSKICVFGGHDTWLKSIKPLLPNTRFISREVQPNPDIIKNADIIWLQSNSMSHSYYYKVIDTARANNIPCRYFRFASAQKCAEQLATNDMKR